MMSSVPALSSFTRTDLCASTKVTMAAVTTAPFTVQIFEDGSFGDAKGMARIEARTPPFTVSVPDYLTQESKKEFLRKGSKTVFQGIGWALFFLLLFLVYGNLPNRWYRVLYVYSGSMSPAIQPGDVLIITPPKLPLEPGMILTLRVDGVLVTHRLISIDEHGQLITKGDANDMPDDWSHNQVEIGGIVRARIPLLGYLARIPYILKMPSTGGWFSDSQELILEIYSGNWFLPTAEPGQRGTSITASVSVENLCERVNEANDPAYSLIEGETAFPAFQVERCQDEDPSQEDSVYQDSVENLDDVEHLEVRGLLCVSNTGSLPTAGLTASFQVQYKQKEEFQELPESMFMLVPTEPLQPGELRCYPYHVDFLPVEGVENYRVIARVTITNHSGYLPHGPHCPGPDLCPFGPSPKESFKLRSTQDAELEEGITPVVLNSPINPTTPSPAEQLPLETIQPNPIIEITPIPTETTPTDEQTETPTAESTQPTETTPTVESTLPTETTPTMESTLPTETTPTMESTLPTEATPPAEETPSSPIEPTIPCEETTPPTP